MAEYLRPQPGGAKCPDCNELTAAYRVLPVQDGCRVRYHRCVCCGCLFKSVERVVEVVVQVSEYELRIVD